MVYSKLLEGINPQWSVKEKAKYLYEQVCINSIYDERIEYTKSADLIRNIYYRDINVDEDQTNLVVCNTICQILQQLFIKENIECRLVKEKSKISRALEIEDVALVFKDGEEEYLCSPVGDIQNCKYTLMPRFFGNKKKKYTEAQNVKELSPEENRKIDRKIGYLPKLEDGQKEDEKVEDSYSDIVFKEIADEVKNTEHFKLFLAKQGIEIPKERSEEEIEKIRDLIVAEKVKTVTDLIKWRKSGAGTNEIKQFYIKLFHMATFNKLEKPRFKTYEFYKQTGDSIEIVSVIEIMLTTGPIYYIYSREEDTYIFVTYTELKERINGYSERKNKRLLIDEEFGEYGEKIER